MRRDLVLWCCLIIFSLAGWAQTEPPGPAWSWELVGCHVPVFREKARESKQLLIVEVLFRCDQQGDQALSMASEGFRATDSKGRPVEILGLLFGLQKLEGAKRMSYLGGMKRMETLTEIQGDSTATLIHSPGPVEVVVEGGKIYRQRLLLERPKGRKPIRLGYGDLAELEIPLSR